MKPGDLVISSLGDNEELFYEHDQMDPDFTTNSFMWISGEIGMLLEYMETKPFPKVKILVGEKSGWTWSDYIKPL